MFRHNKNEMNFRRLSILIDNIQNQIQKKLLKAENIVLLINQCHKLELEDEKFFTIPKNNFNQTNNKIISQVNYLNNYWFQFDLYFDELSLFWMRYSQIQFDIYIRFKEKCSLTKSQNFYKKQLKDLIRSCV